jgi:hypothetical protein
VNGRSGGSSAAHRSWARGQPVRKRQPDGGAPAASAATAPEAGAASTFATAAGATRSVAGASGRSGGTETNGVSGFRASGTDPPGLR